MTVTTAYAPPRPATSGNGAPPALRRMQGLVLLVHGHPKAGKSSLGDSGPRPVLILDAETAGVWTPSWKVFWDPARETCPTWPMDARAAGPGNPQGLWDTCIVIIHDHKQLFGLLTFLQRGQHPFNSLSMDSVSNIQDRVIRSLAGTSQMERGQWYALLRTVNALIGGYKDLVTHPYKPLWAVTYVCGTHWDMTHKKWRPMLQGQSANYVPYAPDIEGWVYPAADGTRHMWIGPSPEHETGDRLWGRLPSDMVLGYPNMAPGWTVESMVSQALGLGQQTGR